MRIYKSSDLINSIKRKGMLPETQNTFTEQDFLDLATEELDLAIVPLILLHKEDYYLTSHRIEITSSNQRRFKIPHRAIGNKVRFVGVENGDSITTLFRVSFEDAHRYDTAYGWKHYYIENDEIVLCGVADPGIIGSKILIMYYIRPSALVPDEKMLTISAISGNTITLLGDIDQYTLNDKIDFISHLSPSKLIGLDYIPTSINYTTNQMTFTSLPSELSVGDYLCFAEQTAIPQIPTELQSLLTQRVVARCLEALGDAQGLQIANAKIAEIEQKSSTLLGNRVEAQPKKIIPKKAKFHKKFW